MMQSFLDAVRLRLSPKTRLRIKRSVSRLGLPQLDKPPAVDLPNVISQMNAEQQ